MKVYKKCLICQKVFKFNDSWRGKFELPEHLQSEHKNEWQFIEEKQLQYNKAKSIIEKKYIEKNPFTYFETVKETKQLFEKFKVNRRLKTLSLMIKGEKLTGSHYSCGFTSPASVSFFRPNQRVVNAMEKEGLIKLKGREGINEYRVYEITEKGKEYVKKDKENSA